MTQATTKKHSPETSAGGKILFVGKLIIFLVSFGFVYPTLFSD